MMRRGFEMMRSGFEKMRSGFEMMRRGFERGRRGTRVPHVPYIRETDHGIHGGAFIQEMEPPPQQP